MQPTIQISGRSAFLRSKEWRIKVNSSGERIKIIIRLHHKTNEDLPVTKSEICLNENTSRKNSTGKRKMLENKAKKTATFALMGLIALGLSACGSNRDTAYPVGVGTGPNSLKLSPCAKNTAPSPYKIGSTTNTVV